MFTTIYFATDHAGFELKQALLPFVRDVLGYEVVDCGAPKSDPEDDFTTYVAKAAREVSLNPYSSRAIILGGSGQGEAMLANRFAGVRAVVYYGKAEEIITLSRMHNDANVLSLGARFLTIDEAKKAVMLWLHTEHTPAVKYDRRIAQTDFLSKREVKEGNTKNEGLDTLKGDTTLPKSVAPSLPARSYEELQMLYEKLRKVITDIQVDIVDGVFAPHTSWPFTENDPRSALLKLRSMAKEIALEIDCMCVNPQQYLDIFTEIGVQRVIIHAGSTTEYEKCINHARKYGYKIGLAILNSTDPKLFDTYATYFDFVQVMGIKQVGAQGAPFDENTLTTVQTLRSKYPRLEIAVDGAVNSDTMQKLMRAGANRFAPGSAIARSEDPAFSYTQLHKLIS